MQKATLVLSLLSLCLCQSGLMALCPTGVPNEIFCDDFDTYCDGGGFPGTPDCTDPQAGADSNLLRTVWYQTSYGTTMKVEDTDSYVLDGVYSARYPSKIELGQQTVRDWVASPPLPGPEQVLDFSRRIGEIHGSEYAAVIGADAEPLTLTFSIGAPDAKLWLSSGYMELAFGPHTDPMNMANTDYAIWPKVTCCNGTVANGPWPLLCAQGNPLGAGMPPEAGCPDVALNPPPVRNAIAVGSLPVLDTDPCHCGGYTHAPQAYNLAFYDGQLWWTLNSSAAIYFPGATLSGSRTPLNGAPETPPANYPVNAEPGKFYLNSPLVNDASVPPPAGQTAPHAYRSRNTVTLTIKRDVIRIELASIIECSTVDPEDPTAGLYYEYLVTSVLDNVPLKYAGPFDRLREGVGPGCELLTSNPATAWSTCRLIDGRKFLQTPQGYFVLFDKVSLHGGIGYTVKGACCNGSDGACTVEYQHDCITHGRWTKSSQTCEETICCPQIYGDADFNGSVDMDDFAALQACITTGGGSVSSGCNCADYNADGAIDSADVGHFADCANGPGIPGDGSGACAGRGW